MVIAEIITASGAEKNIQKTMQSMFEQMNAIYPQVIRQTVESQTDLTSSEKEELIKTIVAKTENTDKRFQEKLFQQINFKEFIGEIFYPLYAKYFSVAELKDLLVFYKSPTGQKFNNIMPQFSAESVRLTNEYMLPKIDKIMKEVVEEDIENAADNINMEDGD